MEETNALLNGLYVFLLIGGLSIFGYIAQALRSKFINEASIKEVEKLESAAYAAVRAAEQKIDSVSKLVTDLLGEAPSGVNEYTDYIIKFNEEYKKYQKLTNEQKKEFAMDFLTTKFPKLPIEEIDVYLEKAYKEYKDGLY